MGINIPGVKDPTEAELLAQREKANHLNGRLKAANQEVKHYRKVKKKVKNKGQCEP